MKKRFKGLTKKDNSRLGKCYDAHLAREWGLSRETVRKWRSRLGVPSYCGSLPDDGVSPMAMDIERIRLATLRVEAAGGKVPCGVCGAVKDE